MVSQHLTTIVPKPLSRLFELSKAISCDSRGDDMYSFGDIGLFLHRAFDYPAYKYTPTNSVTFASTGGDGVHYGFLVGSKLDANDPPIVMTVPMNFDQPNVIVGSNLKDFLSLGCRAGYFSLEQLVYDPAGTILDLQTGEFYPDTTQHEIELLNLISAEFDVVPWRDPEKQLVELHSKFGASIELQDNEEGAA